ncbi:MAG: ribosome maturation factor RimP [Hungatella sp.]
MAKREEYEARTEQYLLPLMEEYHFELVDVEYVKEAGTWYLRVYVDKEGGIAVDDCAVISRRLGEWLDTEDMIADSYILEVSSPGLGRALKKDKDFVRGMGQNVDIKLYRPLNKQKDFTGILKNYDKNTVTIEMEDETEMLFVRSDIALIRLAFDF